MGESGPSARPIVGLERAQRGPRYTGPIRAFGGAIGFRLGLREPRWAWERLHFHPRVAEKEGEIGREGGQTPTLGAIPPERRKRLGLPEVSSRSTQ